MNAVRQGQRLTPREREIIGGLCVGERPKEIAARLSLCPKTVEAHMANARAKLGARTSAALVYEYVTRYRAGP
jgi:DNA-binding NarL/FixJ family response regulator